MAFVINEAIFGPISGMPPHFCLDSIAAGSGELINSMTNLHVYLKLEEPSNPFLPQIDGYAKQLSSLAHRARVAKEANLASPELCKELAIELGGIIDKMHRLAEEFLLQSDSPSMGQRVGAARILETTEGWYI